MSIARRERRRAHCRKSHILCVSIVTDQSREREETVLTVLIRDGGWRKRTLHDARTAIQA